MTTEPPTLLEIITVKGRILLAAKSARRVPLEYDVAVCAARCVNDVSLAYGMSVTSSHLFIAVMGVIGNCRFTKERTSPLLDVLLRCED